MRLSNFILDNMELILQAWEDFAKTIFPENRITTIKELRDHARSLLLLVAEELNEPGSSKKENKKIKELVLSSIGEKITPAEQHGYSRLADGFSINNLVSEYRALRASVLELYSHRIKISKIPSNEIKDLSLFNELIDQAMAVSISSYTYFKEKQTNIFNGMLSVTPDLHYTLDLDGNILYMNFALSQLYQKPFHQIIGTALYNQAMPSVIQVNEAIKHVITTGGNSRGEVSYKDSSGKDRFFQYILGPVFDDRGKIEALSGASRDITEQKIAEKEIWRHANFDSLTGLSNRHRFQDTLKQEVKHSQRSGVSLGLLFIDLDKFKDVNDTLGHLDGDQLLKEVAERISSCIRDTDTASRIGGDEFTVILVDIKDAKQAEGLAEKLLSALRKPFHFKQIQVHISASIGITISPRDGILADVLLANSDRAMYSSKKAGGDRCSVYSVK